MQTERIDFDRKTADRVAAAVAYLVEREEIVTASVMRGIAAGATRAEADDPVWLANFGLGFAQGAAEVRTQMCDIAERAHKAGRIEEFKALYRAGVDLDAIDVITSAKASVPSLAERMIAAQAEGRAVSGYYDAPADAAADVWSKAVERVNNR